MTPDMVLAPSGITYPVWQRGAGTRLLLLHGFTGSHETWDLIAPQLADRHCVASLDLPGHGRSTLPAEQHWSFSTVIADLAWLIASKFGGMADVLGYSMGGRFALALAASHPDLVRRLMLESASPGISSEPERLGRQRADELLAGRILDDGIGAFVDSWESLPMWDSQAALTAVTRNRQRRIRLGQTAVGLAANLRATGSGAQPSYWQNLTALTTPALLIAGELDRKFADIATAMHAVIPGSNLEIVANAGHAVHLEQPTRYLQCVSQFLDQPL